MKPRLSLGIAIFRKALPNASSSRCVFQAEYDVATGIFFLTQSMFSQRRSRISSVANHRERCKNIADALKRLANAAEHALTNGYVFDVGGLSLIDKDEDDENWLQGLRVGKAKRSPKTKH